MKCFTVFCFGVLAGAVAAGAVGAMLTAERRNEGVAVEVVRDSIVVHDTVCVTVPRYKERVVVDTLVVARPVAEVSRFGDSALVTLERSQLMFSDDSTYQAWISGYEPGLDSLKLIRQRSHVVVERTIDVDRVRDRRWGVTLTAGIGMSHRGVEPFVGVGLSYTLISF